MQINLSLGFSRDVENDFFGYLERVIVTFTVYPRFDESQETIAKALLYWNSRVLFFRSSSEMFAHRHLERFEKHSLSKIVTKRECPRRLETSSNLRAAQVSRQGLLEVNPQGQSFFQSVGSTLPNLGDLMR